MSKTAVPQTKTGHNFRIKSIKDLDALDDADSNDEDMAEDGADTTPFDLNCYELIDHKSKILSFKLMMPDLYEGFKNATPTVLTTLTAKGWAFLWYENLMSGKLSFMCAHVFKPSHNDLVNDVAFLEYPPLNPERYHDLKEKQSYIFRPETNKISIIKQLHNNLGVYQNSYEGTTYDWIFCLKKEVFEIYKAEGLRNFPIKNIKISSIGNVNLHTRIMPKLHLPIQIFSISCRDFNDKISFYGINKSFQLVKYRRDLLQKSSKGEWSFRNVLIAKRDIITDIIVSTDYPIFLNKTITNELWFYIEEQVKFKFYSGLI